MIDLNPNHLGTVKAILAEHVPECEVRAFGSRATWAAKDYSDLDLAILGKGPLDWTTLGRLKEAFEESDLPMRVDVLDWHAISGGFREVIEREHVVLVGNNELSMANGWQTKTLGEVVTLQRGFDLPRTERTPGSYPVIASTGPVGTHNRAVVKGPGVVIGRSGSLGGGQYIKHDFWPLNTTLWVKDFNQNDPRFCYFFLKSLDLGQYNVGSGVPTLNRNHIHPLPVRVPPLPEQRAIAQILGTLDDKIELNRQLNETLEELARAIFKDWFVDFGPVRAKLEGRDTGLPEHLAELFPDRLVESELGEIPEGWGVKTLGELIELAYGKALKAADRKGGTIPVYGSNGQIGWHDKGLVAGPGIVVGRKGNPGIVTWAHSDLFPIDTAFYVVPRDAGQKLPFLFFALAAQDLPSIAADSAVPGLSRKLAYMNRQVVPDKVLVDEFSGYADTIFARRHWLEEESRTLAALRDTLLPKLVSGEVRVDEGGV